MGQQLYLLLVSRSVVVQSVLRIGIGQGIPYRITRINHIRLLHSYGTQRGVLKRMGHHTERVEGLFAKDHSRVGCRFDSIDNIVIPATPSLTTAISKQRNPRSFTVTGILFYYKI